MDADELVRRYGPIVYNLALRLTGNPADAADLTQDSLVKAISALPNLRPGNSGAWVYRITVNTSFMKLRKRKQNSSVSLEEIAPGVQESWVSKRSESSDVNYICSRHELRAELDRAIQKLPEEYRIIFILRDVDGLSNQEVGEILDLSVPAVKSRLHRSRLMLRKRLQRYYEDYSTEQIHYGSRREAELQKAA